jgi:hypothetical protein
MTRKRSPELLAVPLVAIAVVFFGLLYWAVTANTAVAWTLFVVFGGAGAIAGLALVLRNRSTALPESRAASPGDGVYRMLVIVEGTTMPSELGHHVAQAAAGRPAQAFVIAPTLSSRLDWLTGDQAAYDNATAELDTTLAALAAAGVDANGRIGAHEPLQAAADGLREFPADEILVVSSPEAPSSAGADELVAALRERTALPVVQLPR